MKRLLAGACGLAVCLPWQVTIAQQPPNNPLPPAAAGIVAQMDKEILIAKKKAAEGLEKVLRDTTKKGDLAGAMAVKQTVDRLNGEIGAIAQNKGGRGGADIVGRWQGQGQPWVIEFFPDGTTKSSDPGVTGTWIANGLSVEATFNNGVIHTVERTTDGWAGSSKFNGKTTPIRYVRVAP